MAGSRVDQESIHVVVDGIDLGVFQTFAGGASKADDTKNRPGAMGKEESLGGPVSRDPFTVSRVYDLERDHGLMKVLDAKVGAGVGSVSRTKLSRTGTPVGSPIGYTGVLISYAMPDADSNSSDRAEFTLEFSADEAIS